MSALLLLIGVAEVDRSPPLVVGVLLVLLESWRGVPKPPLAALLLVLIVESSRDAPESPLREGEDDDEISLLWGVAEADDNDDVPDIDPDTDDIKESLDDLEELKLCSWSIMSFLLKDGSAELVRGFNSSLGVFMILNLLWLLLWLVNSFSLMFKISSASCQEH